MNKILLYICQLLLLTSCVKAQKKQQVKIDRLNIGYVSLSIMTASRVNCSEFELYFKHAIKEQTLTSREFLDKFLLQLNNLNEIDENYYPEPNTRIKAEVVINDSTHTICIGNLVIKYRGQSYKNDDNFRELLANNLE